MAPLAIESMNDALIDICRALGGSKVVGPMLWPEKTMEQAQRMLLDCLNPDRPARLTPEQTMLLFVKARHAGYHAAKAWFDEATGYTRSEPVEPEDERAKLQREYIAAVAQLTKLTEKMTRVEPTALKVAR